MPTTKWLYARSGNRCAYPDCANLLIDETGAVTSTISHIKGNNPGSARYDASQAEEGRQHYDNLILLCAIHARRVDHLPNEPRYTVELLEGWKVRHENSVVVVAPTSDGIATALLAQPSSTVGQSTGVTGDDAQLIYRFIHSQQAVARIAPMDTTQTPLPLRDPGEKPPGG